MNNAKKLSEPYDVKVRIVSGSSEFSRHQLYDNARMKLTEFLDSLMGMEEEDRENLYTALAKEINDCSVKFKVIRRHV